MSLKKSDIDKLNQICPVFNQLKIGEEINKGAEAKEAIDSGFSPDEILAKVIPITVDTPLDADSRAVFQFNLGVLANKEKAFVALFDASEDDAQIEAIDLNGTLTTWSGDTGTNVGSKYPNAPILKGVALASRLTNTTNLIMVTKDYQKALTFTHTGVSGEAGDSFPEGFYTYENMQREALVGWYSTAGTGVFSYDKKVEIQSMWLEDSGDDSILNIAVYNRDKAEAKTNASFKLAVYNA